MGFSSLFKPDPVPAATVSTPPPTVADTQEQDVQADYSQKASRRRGLLSTILSGNNRRQSSTAPVGSGAAGNSTLG